MPTLSIGLRKNWLTYFQYNEKKGDTTTETRNILLIIFTLVAAVTFQAGVNPPGGVWQEDKDGHIAGRAIYASDIQAYYVFLIFNTLAFSNSILVILSLTHKFPFYFEIWVGTVSMAVTYGSAIFAVSPKESISLRYVLITAAGPFVVRLLVLIFNLLLRKQFIQNPQTEPDSVHA
ncbi:sister chromatid cohesion protein PDS5 [Spatholobus suberectus]|nr:sister chromatid cohesion protein PDS5 [Spatholobus suberectus]